MRKLLSAAAAALLVPDAATVAVGGSGSLLQVPESLLAALEERFLDHAAPTGLKVLHTMGLGDGTARGLSHLAHRGLVAHFIGSHFVLSPPQQELILSGDVVAHALPAGTISLLYRETAAKRPGLLTHVGLGTYVDPRQQGGRLNEHTTRPLSELVHLAGAEWLFYPAIPVDVALLRASTADEDGNLTMEDEGGLSDNLAIAQAARNSGGIVLAEVKQLAKRGSLPAQAVRVPGVLVDHVVVTEHPWQTPITPADPYRSGQLRGPDLLLPTLPHDHRRVIGRRAAAELHPGALVNLGVGMSNTVSYAAAEQGLLDSVVLTVEQGLFGGVPGVGLDSGTATNPDAFIDVCAQFDFYDGGGLDIACLGLGEVDRDGNVNVSMLGGRPVGPGGFIDISQNAGKVVFCGTLTGGGLRTCVDASGLRVLQEGRYAKFVERTEHITFNAKDAHARGQEVVYVTDRAVFRLDRDGALQLVEIAPGIDLDADVLSKVQFPVRVSDQLKLMDVELFVDAGPV